MDKYTVDLDQVLNDFEYSELTDQHSKNASDKSQNNNIPFQPPPITKHSINNVFHSLNEYLNSGISSGSGSTNLNKIYAPGKQENLALNDNKLDYGQSEFFYPQTELKQNSLDSLDEAFTRDNKPAIQTEHFQPKLLNNILINQKENIIVDTLETSNLIKNQWDEDKSNNIDQKTINSLSEEVGLLSDSFPKTDVELPKTETAEISLLDVKNVEPENLPEPELNCTESFRDSESSKIIVINETKCDRNVMDKADKQNNLDVQQKIRGNVEEIKVVNKVDMNDGEEVNNLGAYKKDMLVKIEEDSANKLDSFVIEPTSNVIDLVLQKEFVATGETEKLAATEELQDAADRQDNMADENPIVISNDVEPETSENISSSTEVLVDKNIISQTEIIGNHEETENSIEPPKLVGFTAELNFDENELNQMLEDLEMEEPELQNNILEKEVVEKQATINKDKIVESTEKGQISSLVVDEITIGQAAEPKTANERNKDIPNPQIIECLEVEKPTKSKKSSKSKIQSEMNSKESAATVKENHEMPKLDVTEKEVKAKEENNEMIKQDQSPEPASRPQDLPLNNKIKDDNVGRKIDLIGSPGSTPYNNVYINKSIEPKTTHEPDSDYTSSASPTFSDCSTESTSTASTVSVEDVPNNADKFTMKKSGTKNTNIENERRESASVQNVTEHSDEGGEINVQTEESINLETSNVENATNVPDEAAGNESESVLNNVEGASGDSQSQPNAQLNETFLDKSWLGKEAPLWIPDGDAAACLHCDMKFTVLKRRHHCRACGLVLCSKCCNLKTRLEYLQSEARVCNKCYGILNNETPNNAELINNSPESGNSPAFRPNPNNPLEYCSTVSPLQQAGQTGAPPPSVMVPVGVLKRKGSNKKSNKSVMFCDGIAPGSDLTNLDQDFNYNSGTKIQKSLVKGLEEVKKKEETPAVPPATAPTAKISRNQPKIDSDTGCYIPKSETSLPPTIAVNKIDILYSDCSNSPSVVEMLKNEALVFAINKNLFVHVKVINMSCCINKYAWCFTTEGLINVGSDEIIYLIEYIDEESFVPKDVFFHVQNVYMDAVKGTSVKELGLSLHNTFNFLDSRNHAGFVYIKPTFQCIENLIIPQEPYLVGILIHRWETPWAKLFPLRLILRLGAEYRYYPSPLISTRHRDSVFVEIGHTIINLLADFRNFTYTLPPIRGLVIHMEDKKTTITIPRNRYEQIMKSINNSSEHILAFAGNFSPEADSHLVCIQDTQGHENCYTTHAININNKPRTITGASFIVFNGTLKSNSGLTAKSNIVEDGLMIKIPSGDMDTIREKLRNMKNHTIACGCINATSDETVNIVWGENDVDFNVGVKSPVDLADMKGVPSIRVHNGKDFFCNNATRLIRWTEVFILQNSEENSKNQDPVDISKVSESIAKACCTALVKYLELLVSNSCQKIGIRVTLHVENVSYSAGSNGIKLTPIYMRSLDNELIPVLHRITSNNLGDNAIVLELTFRILNA